MTICWHTLHTPRGFCEGIRLHASYGCWREPNFELYDRVSDR